jgi:hypothetical protein
VTATLTSTSTTTPRPEQATGSISFYRIRVEYATTSDWSTLALLDPKTVLALRLMETLGEPSFAHAALKELSLNQPLGEAEAGHEISLRVDYALSLEALGQPLEFKLQKGDIGASRVSVFRMTPDGTVLIQQVEHAGVVADSAGLNPLSFSVDLASLSDTEPLVSQVRPPEREKLLWAFYYPWYNLQSWNQWLKDWPLERYNSSDPQVIQRQVAEAQSAGIDGFISSWWGPGSDTDQNLRSLLEIAAANQFWVTIYFETLAGPNGAPLEEAEIQRWLAYAIETYRDHPAFYQLDGKPLIVIWASATVALEAWERVFASLRAEGLEAVYLAMGYDPGNLEVFDGLHDYGVFLDPNLAQTFATTARAVRNIGLLVDDPTPKIWAATVQPGYDDTLQPTRQGLVREREDGGFYRSTWEAALQSDPDWIFITTWNEWWEHTHIEPSELYGELYLEITGEYAQRWKAR